MRLKYRVFLIIIILLWVAGNFSFMLVNLSDAFFLPGVYLKKAYSLVCHQNSGKLLCTDYACTLLCARCSGIYIGALLTALVTGFISALNTPKTGLLISAVLFIMLDIVLYNSGVYEYNKIISTASGLFLGSVCFLYIRSGLEKLIEEFK